LSREDYQRAVVACQGSCQVDGSTLHVGAPLPTDEDSRLEALERLGVLHTSPEERYERLARLSASVASAPIALVSLVARDHQWFKAHYGLATDRTDRASSFCAWTLLPVVPETLVVLDASVDPRFKDNPLVLGPPFIKYYCGVPLKGRKSSFVYGTLCVIDSVVRERIDTEVIEQLQLIAEAVVSELEERHQSELLLKAVDSYDKGVLIFDTLKQEREVYFANPAAISLAGRNHVDTLEQPVASVLAGCDAPAEAVSAWGKWVESALRRGVPVEVELRSYRSDGTKWLCCCALSPVESMSRAEDENGSPRFWMCKMTDVTSEAVQRLRLKRQKEHAEMLTQIKSRFLSSLSAEIRTPLHSVITASEHMLAESSGSTHELTGMIYDSAERILDLVADIFDMAEADAGELQLHPMAFNIFESLDRAYQMVSVATSAKLLQLTYQVEANTPRFFYGDEKRILQVLLNLLNNSVSHTDEGAIEVSVQAQLLDEPSSTGEPDCVQALLSFDCMDTGCGLRHIDLESLIEDLGSTELTEKDILEEQDLAAGTAETASLSKPDETSTHKNERIGIGLSIARSLVDMMGGTMTMTSTEGQGSMFSFTVKVDAYRVTPTSSMGGHKMTLKTLPGHAKPDFSAFELDGEMLVVSTSANFQRGLCSFATHMSSKATVISTADALEALMAVSGSLSSVRVVVIDMNFSPFASEEDVLSRAMALEAKGCFVIVYNFRVTNMRLHSLMIRELPKPPIFTKLAAIVQQFEETRARMQQAEVLPLAEQERKELVVREVARGTLPFQRNDFKVLIADDMHMNRFVLTKMLMQVDIKEHNISTCISGKQAIELAKAEPFHIIFMDVHMPEIDGIVATKTIREYEQESGRAFGSLIIALTQDLSLKKRIQQYGMNAFYPKPFRNQPLGAILAHASALFRDQAKSDSDLLSGALIDTNKLPPAFPAPAPHPNDVNVR